MGPWLLGKKCWSARARSRLWYGLMGFDLYSGVYSSVKLCMYVCVCVHVCAYVCFMYVCVCVYVCMCVCLYTCIYACMCVCPHVYTHKRMHTSQRKQEFSVTQPRTNFLLTNAISKHKHIVHKTYTYITHAFSPAWHSYIYIYIYIYTHTHTRRCKKWLTVMHTYVHMGHQHAYIPDLSSPSEGRLTGGTSLKSADTKTPVKNSYM